MRLFITLDIPNKAKTAISTIMHEVAHGTRGIKWVNPLNLHLTLKFLGEVGDDLVQSITDRLQSTGHRHAPFSIVIRGSGAFPHLHLPKVLWIGIDTSKELSELFEDVDAAMEACGFARESRKFSPHLTIARVPDSAELGRAPRVLSTYSNHIFGTIQVHELLLMESILKPTGPAYRHVAMAALSIS